MASFGTAWLTFIAELTFERGHTLIADPADAAIAWVPPDIELVDADAVERARNIIVEHAGETRADEALSTIVAARAHLLAEPHWTLQYIGVRRSHQGRVLGAALAAPGLARCDDEALPCSLIDEPQERPVLRAARLPSGCRDRHSRRRGNSPAEAPCSEGVVHRLITTVSRRGRRPARRG